jgi:1,2-phenylacetyl-CoA epoxidase catalytic subunit
MMSGFLTHPDRRIAALACKVGEEAYFHLKYASGWFELLAEEDDSRRAVEAVLESRLPLALDWFGLIGSADALHISGERSKPVEELRESFLGDVTAEMKALGIVTPASWTSPPEEWRPDARRRGPLPEGLFEVIRFKDPALAH